MVQVKIEGKKVTWTAAIMSLQTRQQGHVLWESTLDLLTYGFPGYFE
jgi:hypothetical protein